MDTLVTYLQRVTPDLLRGIVTTLYLTVVALTLGVIIGLPAALARVYGPRWLHNLAIGYIELFQRRNHSPNGRNTRLCYPPQ